MQRYNIFYQIHKGLRQMLYQTAGRIMQTDFSHAKEANAVLEQVTETLEFFDGHANTEDSFVLPAIVGFEPAAAAAFQDEHTEDHMLSERLRALLNMFHHAVSSEEKNELGSAIRLAFTEFLVFNLKHMAKEENYLNNLLWNYYTDSQLMAISRTIIGSLPPAKTAIGNKWMMRALSNNEIVSWLNAVRQEAPDFVFDGLLLLAEKELAPNRWNVVRDILTEDMLVPSA